MADEHRQQILCKICNDESKYQCPRCHRHTCSLPCYKRHQKLYDCSGKRDPAAKLSRAHLTTTNAIEKDYQFLSGVERAFEHADRGASRADDHALSEGRRRSGNANALDSALDRGQISVLKAPQGMSRQKNNKTRWNAKRKNVVWSVEWLLPDGTSSLRECSEKTNLQDAYRDAFARQPSMPITKRRKVSESAHETTTTTHSADETPVIEEPAKLLFYLVKPFTRGKEKVLVPLKEESTLATNLQGHEVFEFPSIQVLENGPDNLPSGFMHVDTYLRRQPALIAELPADGT